MSDDELRARRRLSKRVDAGDLSRNEQETAISFFGDDDQFQITTYAPPIVRKLLRHDKAGISWVYSKVPGEPGRRDTDLAELAESKDRRHIEGVCATLPLGALTIKGAPRTNDYVSDIVTTPDDLDSLEEAFAGGGR